MANEMSLGMVSPIVVCFALVRSGICSLVPLLGWLTPSSVYPTASHGMLLGMISDRPYRALLLQSLLHAPRIASRAGQVAAGVLRTEVIRLSALGAPASEPQLVG
ncbi:MAG: hypothetical protein WCG47_18850 [Dermatophilaceae bacterium]